MMRKGWFFIWPVVFYVLVSAMVMLAMALAATAADVSPHGHSCATAVEIKAGGELTTALDAVNDHAYFKITLPKRGLLDVWTDPGTLDIWGMGLLDSSCVAIPAINGGASVLTGDYARLTVPSTDLVSEETVSTLPAGTYYIRVDPEPIDVFGDRFTVHTRFRAHFGHDADSAEPVNLNSSIDGELLYVGDAEVFRISLEKPGEFSARVAMPDGNAPELNLSFPDGSTAGTLTVKATDDYPGELTVVSDTLDPGIYFLSVTPSRNKDGRNLGKYELTIGFNSEDPVFNPDVL